ncbi:MAG: deoxyribose-phosphate aldolase [Treponema sp.]|nr:deoxyribose-phosphate aldolase [Treponema sp.]
MPLSHAEIVRMIDVSCVRTDVTRAELEQVAAAAVNYRFVAAFTMPCYNEALGKLLKGSEVLLGGTAGFPSGADTIDQKRDCAKYMKSIGCDELDMVINVGTLKSGGDQYVYDDIKAVIGAAYPIPVKAILECAYLSDEEITRACNIAVEAGAAFVKSGTGWAARPTTVEMIRIMKSAVGNRAQVKAAGGIRSLAVLEEMYDAGCRRFGIGLHSALGILKEAYQREGKSFEGIN